MRIFAGSWAQTSYQILPHCLCGNIFNIIKMCLVTLFFYLPRLIRQLIKDETVVIFNILFYLIFFCYQFGIRKFNEGKHNHVELTLMCQLM